VIWIWGNSGKIWRFIYRRKFGEMGKLGMMRRREWWGDLDTQSITYTPPKFLSNPLSLNSY
jgi:hypothetical protein